MKIENDGARLANAMIALFGGGAFFCVGITCVALNEFNNDAHAHDPSECPPQDCPLCVCAPCDDTDRVLLEQPIPTPEQIQAVQRALDAIQAIEAMPPPPTP